VGVWGAGLYSGDFAADLRAAAIAVCRLPFNGDRLLEILIGTEPNAANNDKDEDHTTFWLLVADQFAKRGIPCDRAQQTALRIIDNGQDIEILQGLGMEPHLLRKRQAMLAELRSRITAGSSDGAKKRVVLKKPQAFLMNAGDVFVYPTCQGHCINSYFASKERIPNWNHDGWGAAVIIEVGRAFEFLAWYRPLILAAARAQKLDMAQLGIANPWALRRPGTCSPSHFKRMELEKIGTLALDMSKVNQLFAGRKNGTYQAINDISVVNELSTAPYWKMNAYPKLPDLRAILS